MNAPWVVVWVLAQAGSGTLAADPLQAALLAKTDKAVNEAPKRLSKDASEAERRTACKPLDGLRVEIKNFLAQRGDPPPIKVLAARSYLQHRRMMLDCVSGRGEGDTWQDMLKTHEALLAEVRKCKQARCAEGTELRAALTHNLRALLPLVPRGRPDVIDGVLNDVAVALPDDKVIDAVVAVIADPAVSEGAVKPIVDALAAGSHRDALIDQLTGRLHDAVRASEQRISDGALTNLFQAIGVLLMHKQLGDVQLAGLTKTLTAAAASQDLQSFAETVLLLGNLGSADGRAALAESVRVLLDHTPELRDQLGNRPVPPASAPEFDEFVQALVRLLTRAQAAEILRARRAAGTIVLSDTVTRRERMVLATWLPAGCQQAAAPSEGALCKLARDFEQTFAQTLGALAPQSTQSAGDAGDGAVGLDAKAYLEQARVAVVERTRFEARCNDQSDAAVARELCVEFGAAVALELSVEAGGLIASASYVSRTVNVDRRSARRSASGIDNWNESIKAGERLAVEVLLGAAGWKGLISGLKEDFAVERGTEHATLAAAQPARPSWYARPQTWILVAGVLAVVGGVYVSNVEPSSPAGDGLWVGGVLTLGTGVGWEILGD